MNLPSNDPPHNDKRVDVLLARQPILDREQRLFGYELLFRHSEDNFATITSGDQATSQVLLNVHTAIAEQFDSSDTPLFINFTRNLLFSPESLPLNPANTVLEILESVRPSEEVLRRIAAYRNLGFRIALDDFVFAEPYRALAGLADFIKIDVLHSSREQLLTQLAPIQGVSAALLAERVETQEMLDTCRQIGFRYFQGYFFDKPQLVTGKKLSSDSQLVLTLLSELEDPELNAQDVAKLVSRDIGLSSQLLRIINSAVYGMSRKVESLQQAIIFLGMKEVKKWAMLIALSRCHNKTLELTRHLLTRARFMELMAEHLPQLQPDRLFTVGLFSGIDAVLDRPIEDAMALLPFDDQITEAVVAHTGTYGKLLSDILRLERGEFDQLEGDRSQLQAYQTAYPNATAWADEVITFLR